jgi:hypothetical protein
MGVIIPAADSGGSVRENIKTDCQDLGEYAMHQPFSLMSPATMAQVPLVPCSGGEKNRHDAQRCAS